MWWVPTRPGIADAPGCTFQPHGRLDHAHRVGLLFSECSRASTHLGAAQRPLTGAARLPFAPLRVGDIYQRFSSPEQGTVQNIIEVSVPSLFSSRPAASASFVVDARYSMSSGRRIALTFDSANLRE